MPSRQGEAANVIDPHSPEGVQLRIQQQAAIIREWAAEQKLTEGTDFMIAEDITEYLEEDDSGWPHERRMFYMGIKGDHYARFREFFQTEYVERVRVSEPKARAGLDFSHSGRFCVAWAGIPCDTAPFVSVDPLVVHTHHSEFRALFREEAGFELPTADSLNSNLKDISENALDIYKEVLQSLKDQKAMGIEMLGEDGYYEARAEYEFAVEVLGRASREDATEEFPEEIEGSMSSRKLFTYADLTYNAEDRADFASIARQFGVSLAPEHALDQILEHEARKSGTEFDHKEMEKLCRKLAYQLYPEEE